MIYLVERSQNGAVTMRKAALNDPALSWMERGLLLYIIAHSENWEWHWKDVWNHGGGGKNQIQKSIAILRARGYLVRWKPRDSHGRFQKERADAVDIPFDHSLREDLRNELPSGHPWKKPYEEATEDLKALTEHREKIKALHLTGFGGSGEENHMPQNGGSGRNNLLPQNGETGKTIHLPQNGECGNENHVPEYRASGLLEEYEAKIAELRRQAEELRREIRP
jgi:hypothetical protein